MPTDEAATLDDVLRELRELRTLIAPTASPSADNLPSMPLTAFMSAGELAGALGVPDREDAVESALRRFRKKNPDCREERPLPRKGEPRHLYHVPTVWAFLLGCLPRWRSATAD